MTHRKSFQFILRFLVPLGLAAMMAVSGCTSSYVGDERYGEPAVVEDPPPPEPRDMFRDLEFYGSWHWVDPFGWVWRPTVVMDWRPFVNGNWLWTEFGWTWVSYEPFGWATCHYGYWANDFALGWIWIPDTFWEPAMVDWYLFENYIAWSPVPFDGYYWEAPWDHGGIDAWVVVPVDKFTEPFIGRYHERVRFRSNSVIEHAPELNEVSHYTPYGITPMRIEIAYFSFGDVSLQRIMLPPDAQARVDEKVAQRKVAFKRAYNDQHGYDPTDPPPESLWDEVDHGDVAKRKAQVRDTKKGRGNADTDRGVRDNQGTRDDQARDDKERDRKREDEHPKTKTKKNTEEKEKPQDRGRSKKRSGATRGAS